MFRTESVHYWNLTSQNSRYKAFIRQTHSIYFSFLGNPTLQNYPYNKIGIVTYSRVGLNNIKNVIDVHVKYVQWIIKKC